MCFCNAATRALARATRPDRRRFCCFFLLTFRCPRRPQNTPLYSKTFNDNGAADADEEMRYLYISHAALDIVEEKCTTQRASVCLCFHLNQTVWRVQAAAQQVLTCIWGCFIQRTTIKRLATCQTPRSATFFCLRRMFVFSLIVLAAGHQTKIIVVIEDADVKDVDVKSVSFSGALMR